MAKDLNVFFKYLEKENITIDADEFYFQYQSHPDYPSLLSISDTFFFFGIDNIIANVKQSNINDLGDDFIAELADGLYENDGPGSGTYNGGAVSGQCWVQCRPSFIGIGFGSWSEPELMPC